jgi:hypothetical protein
MSEIIVTADALRDGPPAPVRQLRGNLGVASIVFMVVAAAAPLGVIGGVVPLGIASGNGAGFPATFIISTVILLFFAVGRATLRHRRCIGHGSRSQPGPALAQCPHAGRP